MNDEKKPPQGAVACSAGCQRETTDLKSRAQVVISIDPHGALDMRTVWGGRTDAMYAKRDDESLLGWVLQSAIAELRLQVREGRRITDEEIREIRDRLTPAAVAQVASGSSVTVNT